MNNYPDKEYWIQTFPEEWWIKDDSNSLCRGALIRAFVKFYNPIPIALLKNRADNHEHSTFQLKAESINAHRRISKTETEELQVAAIPRLGDADCHLISRAKRRPCLVLAGSEHIHLSRIRHLTSHLKRTYFLVAPFYTASQEGKAGLPLKFREEILCAKYKHLFLDILPHENGHESYMRFDQCQPVGHDNSSYQHLGYRLSEKALEIIDEWFAWYLSNTLNSDGEIVGFRACLEDT